MSRGFPKFLEATQVRQLSSTQCDVASFLAARSIQILRQMCILNSAWVRWDHVEMYTAVRYATLGSTNVLVATWRNNNLDCAASVHIN